METFFQQKLICGKNLNLKPLKHVELVLVGFGKRVDGWTLVTQSS